jgi:beta-N-acetylhexosaminidase
VYFRENVTGDRTEIERLSASIHEAFGERTLIAIDQEGGRVRRLGPPFLQLPPMRQLAGDIEQSGFNVGMELADVGITWNFAPVLDVDSNPKNQVIGDRAFDSDSDAVARKALAFAAGLHRAGVLSCGKHFPGHGDTELDSHFALPTVRHDRSRLESLEFVPFRRAVDAKLPALMTAHVVYPALDAANPATLSHAILNDLLRAQWGFDGVVVSDDLSMRAVSDSGGLNLSEQVRLAEKALIAGCDVLLFRHDGPALDAVVDHFATRASTDTSFAKRLELAAERVSCLRRQAAATPKTPANPARILQVLADDPTDLKK